MSAAQILSEPVRVYLLELLCTGAMTSGDLATMCFDRFRIGWSSVSRHITRLEEAGMVRRIVEGSERWVALEPHWLELVRADVRRLEAAWENGRLSRLLGTGGDIYERDAGPDADFCPPERTGRRGRRGRAQTDSSARGLRRSHDADSADGGAGFD